MKKKITKGSAGIVADLSNPNSQTVSRSVRSTSGLSEPNFSDQLSGIENINATQGNDSITGSAESNNIYGYGGSDTINAGSGNDFISTGGGADQVDAGEGDDTIQVTHETAYKGRYVLIRHREGTSGHLSLQEVEVYSGGKNVARNAKVITSSDGTWGTTTADIAACKKENLVDGVKDENSKYASSNSDGNSWVMIDLGATYSIDQINLYARNSSWEAQSNDLNIFFSDSDLSGYGGSLTDLERNASTGILLSGQYGRNLSTGKKEITPPTLGDNKTIKGGAGVDTVDYSAMQSFKVGIVADLSLSSAQTVTRKSISSETNQVTFSDSLTDIENIAGTDQDDDITGSSADNLIFANAGNDTINAAAGDDTIYTGTGQDSVNAGEGDDTVYVSHESAYKGRYVLIRHREGVSGYLSLEEVEVYSGGKNVALKAKPVVANGSFYDDNQTDGYYSANKPTNLVDGERGDSKKYLSRYGESNPWIMIDLGASYAIDQINLFGRTVDTSYKYSDDLNIFFSDSDLSGYGGSLTDLQNNATSMLDLKGSYGRDPGTQKAEIKSNQFASQWLTSKTIDGGDGVDMVDYSGIDTSGGFGGITVDLSDPTNQTVKSRIRINNNTVVDTLKNIENIGTTNGDDAITGSDEDNKITGFEGNDTINAGAGKDEIYTGKGKDSVNAGVGDDTVIVEHESAYKGRYVLIRHREGTSGHLSLQEVEVYSGGENVARNAKVITSSDGTLGTTGTEYFESHKKENLVDGVKDENSKYASSNSDGNSWVMIDLGATYSIDQVNVFGRNHSDAVNQQSNNLKVFFSDSDLSGYGGSLTDLQNNATSYKDLVGDYGRDNTTRMGSITPSVTDNKTIDGGAGSDSVNYSGSQGVGMGLVVDLSNTAAQTVKRKTTASSTDNLLLIDDLSNIENIASTNGDDAITGSDEDNKITGFEGNDTINAGAGNDAINTDKGFDSVDGGADDDTIRVVHEGKSARYVYIKQIENANQTLSFSEIEITSNGQNVIGQSKIKTSNGQTDEATKYLADQKNGDNDANWISTANNGAWLQFNLEKVIPIDKINIYGNSLTGNYSLYLSNVDLSENINSLNSYIYRVFCYGIQNSKNKEYSTEWTDSKNIEGGIGIDTVNYMDISIDKGNGIIADLSTVNNQTVKQIGKTKIDYLKNIENLVGTSGDDLIFGSDENNILIGIDGSDTIRGFGGNDTISVGSGKSSIYGGGGDDTIYLSKYDVTNTFVDGGSGINSIDFSESEKQINKDTGEFIYRSSNNNGIWIDLNSNQGYASYRNENSQIIKENNFALTQISKAYGTLENDYFRTSDSGNNLFAGSDGNDVFDIYGKNNRIDGGVGNDTYNVFLNSTLSGADSYTILADDSGKSKINIITNNSNLKVTKETSKFYFAKELNNNNEYTGNIIISDVDSKYKIILKGIIDFSKQIESVTFTNTNNAIKTRTTLTDFDKITNAMAGISPQAYSGNSYVVDRFWANAKSYITVANI